jgi:hypothetical protein
VEPFSDSGDAWLSTSYCMPAPLRIDLLHVTEAEARRDQQACERRVKEARAAAGR